MSNTLLFEKIDSQAVITSYSGKGKYTSGKQNASGWKRQNIYKVGRDGQTLGNPQGDWAPYPICPYHMPTNQNRFNDPGLNVPYKKVKDIIELKDINRLIERINLYTHLWNADQNDISNYNVSSHSRGKVISNLKLLGTTLEPTKDVQIVYGKNTIRQNTPYIRIKDYSEEEFKALNTTIFSNPYAFNQGPLDIPVGDGSPITIPNLLIGKIHSTENPVIFHTGQERLFRATSYLKNDNLVLVYHDEQLIAENKDGLETYSQNDLENSHFEVSQISSQLISNKKYFVVTYRTIDKEANKPKLRYIVFKLWFYDPVLKIFNAESKVETKESDWSVQEILTDKRGKFPIIRAKDFKTIQQTLERLIDALKGVSEVNFGSIPDSVTKNNILNFKNDQAPYQTEFDKDNPDTNFYNYQAQPQAIIKVGFYNTLVDAYKLLINSCMCNCDCACNSNCVCNTNCGCNYSG